MKARLPHQSSLKDKINPAASSVNFKNTDLNIISGGNVSNYDHKTYIKILYDDNKSMLVNSYCSSLHLLNYIKEKLHLGKLDQIDLMDFDGTLKEIPATSTKTYAIQMIVPGSSYLVLKIEKDPETFEKKYFPMIDESKMNPLINKTLVNLNTGKLNIADKKNLKKKINEPVAVKPGLSTPTTSTSSQSNVQASTQRKSSSNKK